ncbi:MAG: hypothetical protein PHV43_01780 [Candidatus Colwellbacteria bacterium]|nr:hypothetical protein [Candidatus Colwellbacteria bacterium]
MNETKKNTMPKWLLVCLLAGGAILIVAGLLTVFGGNSASQSFVDRFNELQASNVGINSDLTSASNLLLGIEAKEMEKDYTGIISDLQITLANLNDAEAKVVLTSTTLTKLQDMIDDSSDQNVKTTGVQFIDALNTRNDAALKMISDAKDLVNQAATYYNEVANNQQVTIDVDEFAAAANAFYVNSQNLAGIGEQYNAAANAFAEAAGFVIEDQ